MPKIGIQGPNGKRLKPMQQKFLQNYIHKDMTQTAAARDAGYKNPNVSAVQLLNNPMIKERMEEMRQELETKYGVTITKSVRDLQNMRNDAWQAGNISAAIRAEELRLKATGLLVTRQHITHENIDAMTKEEISEKLNELMQRAKDRMIDITPEEKPEQNKQQNITNYT